MAQIVAVITGYCYFVAVSRVSFFYAENIQRIGRLSMYPYLFHYFFVMAVWLKIPYSEGLSMVITLLGSVILVWALSAENFKKFTAFLVRR